MRKRLSCGKALALAEFLLLARLFYVNGSMPGLVGSVACMICLWNLKWFRWKLLFIAVALGLFQASVMLVHCSGGNADAVASAARDVRHMMPVYFLCYAIFGSLRLKAMVGSAFMAVIIFAALHSQSI